MGRKPKLLNTNTRNIILDYISKGNYIKTACMAAGISEHTFYNWEERAEQYNPDNGTGEDYLYFQFFQEVKRAEAQNIARNLQNIQSYADSGKQANWQASAWILERKYPAEFGKRMELEVGPSKVLLALQDQARRLTEVKSLPTPQDDRE
jgi:hypothetical protein